MMRVKFVSIAMIAAGATALALSGGGAQAQKRQSRSERNAELKANATPSGDPVKCFHVADMRGYTILDDSTIDFKMPGGKVLRSALTPACDQLAIQDRFDYPSSGDLCAGTQISVSAGNNCTLGTFQPVTYPKAGG